MEHLLLPGPVPIASQLKYHAASGDSCIYFATSRIVAAGKGRAIEVARRVRDQLNSSNSAVPASGESVEHCLCVLGQRKCGLQQRDRYRQDYVSCCSDMMRHV